MSVEDGYGDRWCSPCARASGAAPVPEILRRRRARGRWRARCRWPTRLRQREAATARTAPGRRRRGSPGTTARSAATPPARRGARRRPGRAALPAHRGARRRRGSTSRSARVETLGADAVDASTSQPLGLAGGARAAPAGRRRAGGRHAGARPAAEAGRHAAAELPGSVSARVRRSGGPGRNGPAAECDRVTSRRRQPPAGPAPPVTTSRDFVQPPCADGHTDDGGECPEWACADCGAALVVGGVVRGAPIAVRARVAA